MIVDFYEREGCHLCEEALEIVMAECQEAGVTLRRHDITTDEGLQQRYGEFIPVVVMDDVQHSTWFVDAERLRNALQGS